MKRIKDTTRASRLACGVPDRSGRLNVVRIAKVQDKLVGTSPVSKKEAAPWVKPRLATVTSRVSRTEVASEVMNRSLANSSRPA